MNVENPTRATEIKGPTEVSPLDTAELAFSEDLALAHLKNPELPTERIEELSKNASALKSRKVRLALASHLRTPRSLALRLIRELYTFDLMRFSLKPAAPADLKHLADELLVTRLPSITLGERISLARRSSTLVAAALLVDKDPRAWQAALDNPRLTEAAIVKALQGRATAAFVEAICHHTKWSVRHEVRIALLRNQHTPLARAVEFARALPPSQLRDVLFASRLPERMKADLRKTLETKTQRA
jgi:hypothetical protein